MVIFLLAPLPHVMSAIKYLDSIRAAQRYAYPLVLWVQLAICAYPTLPKSVRDSLRQRLPVIFPPNRSSDIDANDEMSQDPVFYILEPVVPYFETIRSYLDRERVGIMIEILWSECATKEEKIQLILKSVG